MHSSPPSFGDETEMQLTDFEMKRLSLTTTLIGLLLNLQLMAQSVPIITMGLPSPIEQLNPITNFLADASIVNEYLYCSLLRPD